MHTLATGRMANRGRCSQSVCGGSCGQDLLDGKASIIDIHVAERGMDEEGEAGFSQLSGDGKALRWASVGKGFFQIDFAAAARIAWNAFSDDGFDN